MNKKITSCISSELDLFQPQDYQNIIRESNYVFVGADMSVENRPLITVAPTEHFIDLSKTFLVFKIKVFKGTETDVATSK